jgi:Na+-transporting methylmalonyl-CoA/oxaloacetate decarboxylase gamma subunit
MLHYKVRMTALAGCAMSVLVIAGCGAREPVEAPPASNAAGYGAAQTPELMGAPPAETTPADGLLGGPAPVATAEPAPAPVFSSNPNLKTWRRADGTLVTAMAPIANPKATRYAPRAVSAPAHRVHAAPAPVAKPAAKPVVAAAPAPVKPVVAAKPAVIPAKAPVVAPAAIAAAKPIPPKALTKLEKLQAAVAPEATKGATLATAESLNQGKEGQVTLSLPATLGDLIKKEAAKLGLTKSAKKTSAYADLQGQGYEITPNGRQTAEVKAGEPATFAWQVKPTPAAKGPLKTDFGVELNGTKPTQGFTLGSIAKQVAPIQEAVKEKTKGFKFAMPNLGRYETVDLPGVGKVPGKSLLGGALVLLALLILVAIARNASASKAREERRRKFRTLTDYGRNEMEHDEAPQSAKVNYVNPMVAAAGGALAGAAVATAVNHHDDHGHDEHSPFEAPAHDHGHDDHGHGHDDHHVAPVAGAEALPVSGHDHAADHHADAHHDDHGHGHDDHGHAEAGHDDGHAHDGHADHKELEHAH